MKTYKLTLRMDREFRQKVLGKPALSKWVRDNLQAGRVFFCDGCWAVAQMPKSGFCYDDATEVMIKAIAGLMMETNQRGFFDVEFLTSPIGIIKLDPSRKYHCPGSAEVLNRILGLNIIPQDFGSAHATAASQFMSLVALYALAKIPKEKLPREITKETHEELKRRYRILVKQIFDKDV